MEYNRVLAILEGKYEQMKVQTGDEVKYIGLEIKYNNNNTYSIGMSNRIKQVGIDFGISIGKPVRNPANTNTFSKASDEKAERFKDSTKYRSLVMTIAYISIVQPSVKYHVSHLATKQINPALEDWKKAMHLMQHLLSVCDEAMIVRAIGKQPVVNVYCDAAFDVYPDSRSHSGIAVFVGSAGCAQYCSSNKQHCLTRSSTDAEVVSAETGVFIGCYFRDFLEEIGIVCDVIHHEDNNSCISLVKTGTRAYDRKERHMVRRINYMKEYFDNESHRSEMCWCSTDDMVADVLTKDLRGEIYDKHRSKLMGYNI